MPDEVYREPYPSSSTPGVLHDFFYKEPVYKEPTCRRPKYTTTRTYTTRNEIPKELYELKHFCNCRHQKLKKLVPLKCYIEKFGH